MIVHDLKMLYNAGNACIRQMRILAIVHGTLETLLEEQDDMRPRLPAPRRLN